MTDPISRFRSWYRAAVKAGVPMVDAMVLATADRRGRPSARYVLLKEASERGFVFYTNAKSRKGSEMKANDRVALVFYWDLTGRQVRIEGKVRELPAAEAEEYWRERPAGSRFASAASEQSRPIGARSELLKRYSALEAEQQALGAKRHAAEYYKQAPEVLRDEQKRIAEIEKQLLEKLERWEMLEK